MKVRFFKFAREASKRATYQGSHRFSPMIGIVAEYKGSIVASASNSNKTSPLQARYHIYRFNANTPDKMHAEVALVQRLRWKFGDSLDWEKVHIYLYREYKDGTLAPSRPCISCMAMLRELGIKRIAYTTEDGYAEERFK